MGRFLSGQRDRTVNATREFRWFESTPPHHIEAMMIKGLFDDGRAQSDVPVRVRGLQEALELAESGDDTVRLCKILNALLVLETGAPEWARTMIWCRDHDE